MLSQDDEQDKEEAGNDSDDKIPETVKNESTENVSKKDIDGNENEPIISEEKLKQLDEVFNIALLFYNFLCVTSHFHISFIPTSPFYHAHLSYL